MKRLILTFITAITLFLCSCQKDESNSSLTNLPPAKEKNYKITVVDETNQPIANAIISDGTNSINSSTTGTAIFNIPKETYGKYRFSISKEGYFMGSINLQTFSDPDSDYKVMLLKTVDPAVIPTTGGTVTGTGWTFTSTGGFNYENGTTATGNIEISIRYIKPNDFESVRNAFPGQDFTGLSGNNDGWLYIYGWVAINYSQNGVRVYPSAGSVNIKVQVPGIYANAAQNGGKVFYYDEAASIWEESANPTVAGLDVTMPLPSQTTFCALGKMVPTATIKYKKTTCMPGDFYGYAVQVELDFDRLLNYIDGLPGYHVDTQMWASNNGEYGANLYPSGFALGNIPCYYGSHVTASTDGTYTNGLYDNQGFESETFTFPSAYDGGIKIHSIRIPLQQGHENDPISDKIIKEYSSFPTGVTNLGLLNTVCGGTIPNPHNDNSTTGTGQFIYDGQTINGTCSSIAAQTSSCTGIDVLIVNASQGSTQNFIIRNMPQATSGTFNVNGNGTTCNPFASTLFGGACISTSGTITKIGAKSFTFSITMDNISTGVSNKVATGSGAYN